jgi:hypothetical protein
MYLPLAPLVAPPSSGVVSAAPTDRFSSETRRPYPAFSSQLFEELKAQARSEQHARTAQPSPCPNSNFFVPSHVHKVPIYQSVFFLLDYLHYRNK